MQTLAHHAENADEWIIYMNEIGSLVRRVPYACPSAAPPPAPFPFPFPFLTTYRAPLSDSHGAFLVT